MIKIILFLGLVFLPFSASSTNFSNPINTKIEEQILSQIIQLAKDEKPDKAKEYLTTDSHDVFDRLYKHNLTGLIPSNIYATNKEQRDGYSFISFTNKKDSKRSSVLAFKKEKREEQTLLKLDLPKTFELGFGKDWRKTINLIEQSYLLARQYYGEEESKTLLEKLIQR